MRIDLNTSTAAVENSHIEKATQSPHAGQSGNLQSTQTRVSEIDAKVGQLATAAMSAPEVRNEKVQALKSELQSGTYQVSAKQIAGSMLEQMRVRA